MIKTYIVVPLDATASIEVDADGYDTDAAGYVHFYQWGQRVATVRDIGMILDKEVNAVRTIEIPEE